MDELLRLQSEPDYESPWLANNPNANEHGDTRRLTFQGKEIFLFISGAPCGDASLDTLSEHPENSVPWTIRPEDSMDVLHGHEYLWLRGKVRLKPGQKACRIWLMTRTRRRTSNFVKVLFG
jgi:hypothetical protein